MEEKVVFLWNPAAKELLEEAAKGGVVVAVVEITSNRKVAKAVAAIKAGGFPMPQVVVVGDTLRLSDAHYHSLGVGGVLVHEAIPISRQDIERSLHQHFEPIDFSVHPQSNPNEYRFVPSNPISMEQLQDLVDAIGRRQS